MNVPIYVACAVVVVVSGTIQVRRVRRRDPETGKVDPAITGGERAVLAGALLLLAAAIALNLATG